MVAAWTRHVRMALCVDRVDEQSSFRRLFGLVRGCCAEQEDIFEDFLALDDDLELDVDLDMDMSQDYGMEVVGGDITEIIISDNMSEVRC